MQSKAATVAAYLKALPAERRKALQEVRKVIKAHLPKGYKEVMQYGMISYVVPLSVYPAGYLNDKKTPLPYAALAAQKHHLAVYLMNIYADKDASKWFTEAYRKSRKKLDAGKSCVRFKKLEDLPLDVIGKAVARHTVSAWIKVYEASRRKRA